MMSPALPGGRGPCDGFVLLTSGWNGSRLAVTASDFTAGAGALASAPELGAVAEVAAFEEAAFAFRAAFLAGALCAPAADESVNDSASAAHTVVDDFASFIVFALRRLYLPARQQAPRRHPPLS
jgi:hypothetical protein